MSVLIPADKEVVPRAAPGLKCPLWKEDVSKVCHTCPLWMGLNNSDGTTTWGCSLFHLPRLLIEVAQQTHGGAVASEEARNLIVEQLERTSNAMEAIAGEARDIKLLSSR